MADKSCSDWFRAFYVTPFMVKNFSFTVRQYSNHEAEEYEEPLKPYNLEKEQKDYETGMAQYRAYKDKNPETSDLAPNPPLSPEAHSMVKGSLYEYEDLLNISAFDDTTLSRMIVPRVDPLDIKDLKNRRSLLNLVQKCLEEELEVGYQVSDHPAAELANGLLCAKNWELLSYQDLAKWGVAHGAPTGYLEVTRPVPQNSFLRAELVRIILQSQVVLLEEIVSKGHSQSFRGYDRPRGILKDNKIHLGLALNPEDEPFEQVRNKKRKAEDQ